MDGLEYRFELRKSFTRTVSCLDGLLCGLYLFCPANISRIFSGEGELCQAQRVGTIGRSLSGGNQLIGGRYRIVDLLIRVCYAVAVEDAVRIDIAVKMIGRSGVFHIQIGSCCQITFVCCCCRDGTGIHKSHGSNLTILKLTSLTVREISGRVTNAEGIVGRCVACAEAGTAEGRLHDSASLHKLCQSAVSGKLHVNRGAGRINTQSKLVTADAAAFQNICCRADIFKTAACTACDDSLIHIEFSVPDFVFQCEVYGSAQGHFRTFFYICKDIVQVPVQLIDGIGVAGMEGHGDHRTDLT